jgi:hypothetical protein
MRMIVLLAFSQVLSYMVGGQAVVAELVWRCRGCSNCGSKLSRKRFWANRVAQDWG